MKTLLVFDNNEFYLFNFENANKQSKKVIKDAMFVYLVIS